MSHKISGNAKGSFRCTPLFKITPRNRHAISFPRMQRVTGELYWESQMSRWSSLLISQDLEIEERLQRHARGLCVNMQGKLCCVPGSTIISIRAHSFAAYIRRHPHCTISCHLEHADFQQNGQGQNMSPRTCQAWRHALGRSCFLHESQHLDCLASSTK